MPTYETQREAMGEELIRRAVHDVQCLLDELEVAMGAKFGAFSTGLLDGFEARLRQQGAEKVAEADELGALPARGASEEPTL
jgi:hypothetical protein